MRPSLGATCLGRGRCRFCVWAPRAERVTLRITAPRPRELALERRNRGYHEALVDGVEPGTRYAFSLDGGPPRPDPASRAQPGGVHGPSEVVDPRFDWSDHGWRGLPLERYLFYELHVGTFSAEGTFDGVIGRLAALRELGVTAIELMPVAQFPGERNWGYDGVSLFAVQNSYGGPAGLKRLVDACHGMGLAVVLDVVYNHVGPEGNYLAEFGPYFTPRHQTPWGDAVNFDGEESDEVRRFFVENALHWITEYHVDALRLDAVHAIVDTSATHFLEELARAVHDRAAELNRAVHVIAESDLNDTRLVRPPAVGGYGLDAQWTDDFHHALHALLTGERAGYYADYGRVSQLARALRLGYVFTGQYSSYRRRRHGNDPSGVPARRFVVCGQNHDQVGNRLRGERLAELVDFAGLKLAAGTVLLSPFLPLLFMGEEYGERARFPYFVSHSDPELIEAVRRGRAQEFAAFGWQDEPPDPQDEATFRAARPDPARASAGEHAALLRLYHQLIRLRRDVAALARLDKDALEVVAYDGAGVLFLRRWADGTEAAAVFHYGDVPAFLTLPLPAGRWEKRLDSDDPAWHGPGPSLPAVLDSAGEPGLTIPPRAFSLWLRTR